MREGEHVPAAVHCPSRMEYLSKDTFFPFSNSVAGSPSTIKPMNAADPQALGRPSVAAPCPP